METGLPPLAPDPPAGSVGTEIPAVRLLRCSQLHIAHVSEAGQVSSQRLGLMPGASIFIPLGLCGCTHSASDVFRLRRNGLATSGALSTSAESHSSTAWTGPAQAGR